MKKWLVILLVVTVAGSVFAGSPGHSRSMDHRSMTWMGIDEEFLEQQLEAALAGKKNTAIGDLTIGEAEELLGEISIAYQKAAFVAKSRAMSMMLPGLGQFMNDDVGMGVLFLSADLLVGAGTLLGAYFLLPDELRFDQLNYFNDSYATIKGQWEAQSFADFLPSIGVLAGGGLIQLVLRGVSSKHAARLAERNIAEGKITFEPKVYTLPVGPGAMGFGMGMKY
jgi:TM2 domain-containing membrane protein YozV